MTTDEFSQALMDSQETYVAETQSQAPAPMRLTYPQRVEIPTPQMTGFTVEQIAEQAAAILAKKSAIKNGKAHSTGHDKGVKTSMKWEPFLSMFVLKTMCDIIKSGVRTEKGFKEVHLNSCARKVFEFCGIEVSSQQVYNHLRKWRTRWIHISKLRDLSGAGWDEDTCTIMLEEAHYRGHIVVIHFSLRVLTSIDLVLIYV